MTPEGGNTTRNNMQSLDELLHAWTTALSQVEVPSALELASTQLLLASENFASHKTSLHAAVNAALKWKRADLWMQALEKWSHANEADPLQSHTVFEAIQSFGFEAIQSGWACYLMLSISLISHCSLDTSFERATDPRSVLRLTEELKIQLEASRTEIHSDANLRVLSWLSNHRKRLCDRLVPALNDEYDRFLQHCLQSGGLSFMKTQ